MYNLNKILNRIFKKKQVHDSNNVTKLATTSLSQTANTTTKTTTSASRSKFRFLKKTSKKCARDQKSSNLSSSFKSSTTTIFTTLTTTSSHNDQSLGKSLDQLSTQSSSNELNQVVAEQVVYNQETKHDKHQRQIKDLQISRISLLNSSMSSDKYTIEQMYNDNNVQTSIYFDIFDKNVYSTGSLNDSSSSSSDDSVASEEESREMNGLSKVNIHRIGSNQTLKSMLDTDLSDEMFKSSISLHKLEELIRVKIAALKLIAHTLNIQIPKHLTMLETIYDLKMDQVRKEAKEKLKRFEYHDDQTTSLRDKFKNRTNKFFKMNTYMRTRSKSVECNKMQMETSCSSNKSNRSDRSDKSDQEFKHKNYYSLERDTIERKFEDKMRMIQFEILNSINSIELQFEELKRTKELELKGQHLTPQSNRHRHRPHHQLGHCHHHRRCKSRNPDTSKQTVINYSTEHALQKRIRRTIQNRTLELNKSNQSLGLHSQTLNRDEYNERRTSRFRMAFDSNEYKNPNAFETMV